MTEKNEIIISTSKKKLLLLSLTCAVFIFIGIWLISYKPTVRNPFFDNIFLKYIGGGLSVIVFGAFIIYPIIKLFDKKPAIIIDNDGIHDNSSAVALGLIYWKDITAIKETRVFTQKFITILLNDPEKYISRPTNNLKRKTLIANFKKNGSPVNISTNSIAISHEKLLNLLKDKWKSVQLTTANS